MVVRIAAKFVKQIRERLNNFFGSCVDGGAMVSVVIHNQLNAYCKLTRHVRERISASHATCAFGIKISAGLGVHIIQVPFGETMVEHDVHQMEADLALVLGLDFF